MKRPLFFKILLGLSAFLALLIHLLSFLSLFESYSLFSWGSFCFFILFTMAVFFIAERAKDSPNLNTFSSVILGVIFIKMIFIIIILLIYKKTTNPESAWFLVPFFLIYLVFTIFEVYFMSKLGRIKPSKSINSEV